MWFSRPSGSRPKAKRHLPTAARKPRPTRGKVSRRPSADTSLQKSCHQALQPSREAGPELGGPLSSRRSRPRRDLHTGNNGAASAIENLAHF
ncbi:hypothetical protein B296_00038240 [Ensete ventricosum]|uniref:Uncharacterized protein n=1 Tax=Ensete ventricosum TaxID=4639 RepID=A0A426X035_ENSVE|nr:hypothetical protein B296_00038240 [Ensete ventricosum]